MDGTLLDSDKYSIEPTRATIAGDPTLLLADDLKDYRIVLSITKEELERGGVIVRVVSKSDLPSGISFDGNKDFESFTIKTTSVE